MARLCSAEESQPEDVLGKSGSIYIAHIATEIVSAPSTKKSHRHAAIPYALSMIPRIPEANSEPAAFAIRSPLAR